MRADAQAKPPIKAAQVEERMMSVSEGELTRVWIEKR